MNEVIGVARCVTQYLLRDRSHDAVILNKESACLH